MKVVKKLLAICFLLFGIPFSTMAVVDILNPQTTPNFQSGFKSPSEIFLNFEF
ncbi:hypothetical protein NIES22_51350 [Calothrix brevissima NIES-22]|nr:hypothetical protein NIES22_51350 [Calothrix brevissima NIES-22]